MRDFDAVLPSDGIASVSPKWRRRAVVHLEEALEATVSTTRAIRFGEALVHAA